MSLSSRGEDLRFLFILSTERSGSTLLSFMLGAHSGVIAPPELHLLAYPTFDVWRQQYPAAMQSLSFLLASCGLMTDEEQIDKQFTGWTTESVYQWILKVVAQKGDPPCILVDKTPKYARDLITLQRTAKLKPFYIWLIRHPLGVAASQIDLRRERRQQRNTQLLPRLKYPLFRVRAALRKREDVGREVAYWTRVHTQIDQFLATIEPERKHQVHFEQLVKEPRLVIDRVCQSLGISFEPGMLDPRAHIPTVLHPDTGDPKVRRHTHIDPTVADFWRQQYSERLLDLPIQQFRGISPQELMARWGIG